MHINDYDNYTQYPDDLFPLEAEDYIKLYQKHKEFTDPKIVEELIQYHSNRPFPSECKKNYKPEDFYLTKERVETIDDYFNHCGDYWVEVEYIEDALVIAYPELFNNNNRPFEDCMGILSRYKQYRYSKLLQHGITFPLIVADELGLAKYIKFNSLNSIPWEYRISEVFLFETERNELQEKRNIERGLFIFANIKYYRDDWDRYIDIDVSNGSLWGYTGILDDREKIKERIILFVATMKFSIIRGRASLGGLKGIRIPDWVELPEGNRERDRVV